METIKYLMFNGDSVVGILFAFLISLLVNVFKYSIYNGFKIIVIPLYILFFLFVIYKTTNNILLSENAINEEVNYAKSFEIWKKKKPNQVELYLQLKYLRNNSKCLVCGEQATYGIIYKPKYASSEGFRPKDLLVCYEHRDLLNIYNHDGKMSHYFKSSYQNRNGFLNLNIVQNIDNNSMEEILSSSIPDRKIEIKNLIDNISKSKEEILSDAGTFIWMLVYFTFFLIVVDKSPEKD